MNNRNKIKALNKRGSRGFTLIEILTVITVIGLLAAMTVVGGPKVMSMARVASAQGDIRNMQAAVTDAISKLGGTLPITEGTMTASQFTGTNLSAAGSVTNAPLAARLEQVLMGVPQPLLDSYFRPSLGSQNFARGDNLTTAELVFNSTTGTFSNSSDTAIAATMTYANTTRMECRTIVPATTPGVDGSNFRLNGVSNLPAGRVAYIVYEQVPPVEAYNLAVKLNGNSLMTDTSGAGTVAQTSGIVTYAVPVNGVTDVYVYLAHF